MLDILTSRFDNPKNAPMSPDVFVIETEIVEPLVIGFIDPLRLA